MKEAVTSALNQLGKIDILVNGMWYFACHELLKVAVRCVVLKLVHLGFSVLSDLYLCRGCREFPVTSQFLVT